MSGGSALGFQLTISKGLQQGRELSFEQPEVEIGRTSESDVMLQDAGVSRRHVRFVERHTRHYIEDLGSSNGTTVNGERLSGERQLHDGDRISLGPVEFVFKAMKVKEAPPEPARHTTLPDERVSTELEMPAVALPPVTAPPAKSPLAAPPAAVAAAPAFARAGAEPADSERTSLNDAPAARAVVAASPAKSPLAAPPASLASAPAFARAGAESANADQTVLKSPLAAPPAAVASAPAFARAGAESEDANQTVLRNPPVAARAEEPRSDTVQEMPAALPVAPPVVARPESRAMARPAPVASEVASKKGAPEPASLSASERARRRREMTQTLGGQLALWWADLSRGGKIALGILAACFLAGTVAALVSVFRPKGDKGPQGPEPDSLGLQTVTDSFGLGEGVTWERPDLKAFDFEFVSPTRAVGILHYQASGISKDEVSVTVNAQNVGWVPPDTTNSEREVQQILSPTVLKRNEHNEIVFDNVHNPPGHDTWRVWNLRLEIIPVPALRPEELLGAAREYVSKARGYSERRDVGMPNLFLAWENYRSAWITLEALDEKPDLYEDVRYQLGQLAVDLDHKCGQLMLDFQRSVQFRDRKRAVAVLDEVNRRFPTAAHRCHNLALEKANEYGL